MACSQYTTGAAAVTMMTCRDYFTYAGIAGNFSTPQQKTNANVAFFAGQIDQACAQLIQSLPDTNPALLTPAVVTITSIAKLQETATTEDVLVYISVGSGANPIVSVKLDGVILGTPFIQANYVGSIRVDGLQKGNRTYNICIE